MTFRDRVAGAMTYQQGSMHVDDWGRMSLRIQDPLEPDPLKWSVIGWGHKQSFCLMDYGSCSTYQGIVAMTSLYSDKEQFCLMPISRTTDWVIHTDVPMWNRAAALAIPISTARA